MVSRCRLCTTSSSPRSPFLMVSERASSSESACISWVRSPSSLASAATGLHEFGVFLRKFSDGCAVRIDLVEPTPCRVDVDFERAHALCDGQKPRLERVDRLDFVVRVRDLGGNAVGGDFEFVDVGPALELLLEFPIDLGAERIEPVQPPLDRFDERGPRLQTRDLSIDR